MDADLDGDDPLGLRGTACDALVLVDGMHKFIISGKSEAVRAILFGGHDVQVTYAQTATAVLLALHFIR